MRLRLASSLGISLVVALVAVLIDRTVLRGLGLDGTDVVLVDRRAPSEEALPLQVLEAATAPTEVRPSAAFPPTAAEVAAHSCNGRCDTELAGWRRNQGNLAFRTALELCVRKCRRDRPAPTAPPAPVEACSGGADNEDRSALLFEQAVSLLRERDEARACTKLKQVEARAPCGSIWREKAAKLRSRRCEPSL